MNNDASKGMKGADPSGQGGSGPGSDRGGTKARAPQVVQAGWQFAEPFSLLIRLNFAIGARRCKMNSRPAGFVLHIVLGALLSHCGCRSRREDDCCNCESHGGSPELSSDNRVVLSYWQPRPETEG